MTPDCATCQYFAGYSAPDEHYGECRRNAPSPHVQKDEEDFTDLFVWWPKVFDEDWCGEYKRRGT